MNKKYPWLPIDERLIPDIFAFSYPKSPWVRGALFIEMVCAVLAVLGTLVLIVLPRTQTNQPASQMTTTSSPLPSTK